MPLKVNVSKTRKKKQKKQRPAAKAAEMTRLGSALRTLGGLGGGAIGSLIGMPSAGNGIGTNLGAALSRWLGSGDYTVGSNSIVQRVMRGSDSIPAMHNSGQTVTVRHREFIGEIRGATSFTVQDSLQLNPGNSRTFPWLSQIATGFQEYRFKGVVFHYIPSSGSAVASTNAALGTVMLQTSYRSNDSAPSSKAELLNEYCSSEAVPSDTFCHPIECDPKENPFNVMYVRSGDLPSTDNQLFYDLGQTHVCVSGQQASGNVLGDLWVTYEVELKKPIIASNVTQRYKTAFLQYTGTIVSGDWFNGTVTDAGNLGVSADGQVLTFPEGSVGTWMIVVCLSATTTFSAADLSGSPTLTNCTAGNIVTQGQYIRTVLGGSSPTVGRAWYQTIITIANPAVQATVTFPNGALTGASTQSNIWITPATTF